MDDLELFDEAGTEPLEEGLLAFLDVKKNIPTCNRFNPETFYIEWRKEDRYTRVTISFTNARTLILGIWDLVWKSTL